MKQKKARHKERRNNQDVQENNSAYPEYAARNDEKVS